MSFSFWGFPKISIFLDIFLTFMYYNYMGNLMEILSDWWWTILLGLAGLFAICLLIYFFIDKRKTKKRKELSGAFLLSALGGADNVVSKKLIGSRIIVVLKDKSLLNKEILLQKGVDSFIEMSDKITLVVKNNARSLYKAIFGESSEA